MERLKSILASGTYTVVIIDEGNVAVRYGLVTLEDLLDLIRLKPDDVELVITGRDADPELIERANLVTEMKEIKHYYRKGVSARVGIEK